MRIFIILALLVSLSLSCKSKKVQSQSVEKTEQATKSVEKETTSYLNQAKDKLADSLVIRLQRTACFGRCPIYTLSIYKGGYATYLGEKWVEREGSYQAIVSDELIQKILAKAKAINYFKLKDQYDNEYVTDLPSTITTIRADDQLKVVANRYEGPEKLNEFEKYIDETAESIQWQALDEPK